MSEENLPAVAGPPDPPEHPQPPGTVLYRLGGRNYAYEVARNCKVCESTLRGSIESYVVMGRSYASIARALPAREEISPEQIGRHVKGKHIPMPEDVRRQIVEDRARQLGQDPETHNGALGDYISFLRQGMNDITERMVNRDVEPTIAEGIAMARVLASIDVEEDNSSALVQQQAAAVRAILSVVRDVLSDDQFRKFSDRVAHDPAVLALTAAPPQGAPIRV